MATEVWQDGLSGKSLTLYGNSAADKVHVQIFNPHGNPVSIGISLDREALIAVVCSELDLVLVPRER